MHLTLLVAGHQVRIESDESTWLEQIAVLYRPAVLSWDSASSLEEGALRYQLGHERIWFDGCPIEPRARGPIAAFERHLLDELTARGRHLTLLHAGAVLLDGRLVLFVGPSGAGKSSFTKWALGAGAGYLTDDFVFVEGTVVRGVARTVQFDAVAAGPLEPHHEGCDGHSYEGVPGHLVPLYRGGHPVVERYDVAGEPVVVVHLERGAVETLKPMTSLERLGELHAASLAVASPYGGVFDLGPGFRVSWSDSRRAFQMLLRLLEQSGALRAGFA